MADRSAPLVDITPTRVPAASTAMASRWRVWVNVSKTSCGVVFGSTKVNAFVITSCACEKRSTPRASVSPTKPSGTPRGSMTTAKPWARLAISVTVSPTVVFGETVIGVSKTVGARLTRAIDSASTSTGRSWGNTARPPRRAIVSAIRRPEIAVMLATTKGNGWSRPSVVVRSTSSRDVTVLRLGAMKTSL